VSISVEKSAYPSRTRLFFCNKYRLDLKQAEILSRIHTVTFLEMYTFRVMLRTRVSLTVSR